MFRALLACLILAACSNSAPPTVPLDASAAPKFIGILILYKNGEYIHAVTSNKTYDTTKECLEIANKVISDGVANGTIPPDGTAIGACVPIPTLKKTPQEPKPTDGQGSI